MSSLASGPSPSKASINTKRPYEVTTPSNLGTPRDTSATLSGRSPGPSNSKKSRPNGEDAKDIGKGGHWMVAKLDEMQRLYKEVLLAATAVIQYQTYALRLGKKTRSVPVHLQRKVKITWGNFQATRRQVQAYMHEAAQDAATPSSKHLTIPVSSSASLSIPSHDTSATSSIPMASPIPLSASTMLPLPFPSDQSAPPNATATIPKLEPDPQQQKNDFNFNTLPTLPSNNGGGGLGNLDLSNMNMGDFAALMGNNGFDFSSIGQTQSQLSNQMMPGPTGVQAPDVLLNNGLGNIAQPPTQNQSDTDQFLAQLGALTGSGTPNNAMQGQPQPVNPVVDSVGVGEDEVNALLASLNDGDANAPDFTNFDFSDIDLSNLGDMSGLFNTSTIPDAVPAQPVVNQQVDQVPTAVPVDSTTTNQQAQPQQQQPAQAQTQQPQPQSQSQPSTTTQPNAATTSQPNAGTNTSIVQPVQAAQPEPAPAPAPVAAPPIIDMTTSNPFDESQPIDLDDFNFGDGDGDGDGGIDLTGDEFENLLAAFN